MVIKIVEDAENKGYSYLTDEKGYMFGEVVKDEEIGKRVIEIREERRFIEGPGYRKEG